MSILLLMDQGLRCFLIDDDPDDREIFRLALHDLDQSYKCATASNGVEALEMLNDDKLAPDFIFIDVNMPLLSGKKCLKHLRENPKFTQTPIIMYSTSSYEKDIEEAKQYGATHYIIKPSSIGNLASILEKVFQRQKMPFVPA